MKLIRPKVTENIKGILTNSVADSDAFFVHSYNELLKIIAELSYLNRDSLLFFRGQRVDHRNKKGQSTLLPSIYRNNPKKEIIERNTQFLKGAAQTIINEVSKYDKQASIDMKRKEYIDYSIIQHYEVYETPLLDVTQSTRVACSFALINNESEYGYIYILAFPFMPHGISYYSEDELVNIRLLSVCPSIALRPYYQEGYLVGALNNDKYAGNYSEYDFNRRLVAKLKIPNSRKFWGNESFAINNEMLYPNEENDLMLIICNAIKEEIRNGLNKNNGTLHDKKIISTFNSRVKERLQNNTNYQILSGKKIWELRNKIDSMPNGPMKNHLERRFKDESFDLLR